MIALLATAAFADEDAANPWSEVPSGTPYETEAPAPVLELSAQLGSLGNTDPAYDVFGGGDGMPTWGFRLGARLHERVAAQLSWDLCRRGAWVEAPSAVSGGADFTTYGDSTSYVAAIVAHQVRLGLKADVPLAGVVLPYASAAAVLMPLWVRFDDDPEDEHSPGQVSVTGTSFGMDLLGGVELRIPPKAPVQLAWYLEMGEGFRTRASLDDLGTMRPGGFTANSGIGVRF
ncbi:MAG: hypothetical protein H6735_31640 [Alphaproteobacteria bacterium]|nr:hypothetical protein [Alphaproteobacteria bacterium]